MVDAEDTPQEAAKVTRLVHYMTRRSYVPIAVQVIVSEKLVRSLGGTPAPADGGSLSWRWRVNMRIASGIKKITRDSWHLDHDPSLAVRPFNPHTGKCTPDANDPEHLFYRTKEDHRTKTFVHGEHGQYSDIALIKRERRRNQPAKPKRKIASRPFPKRSRTIDH
jgi:hypothetical protein